MAGLKRRMPQARRRVKRARVPAIPRRTLRFNSNQALFSVKRTFYQGNWQPNTTTTNGFWRLFAPAMSDLPSLSEYQGLWDSFRIRGIKATFRPRYDSFAGNDTVDTTLPGVTNQSGTRAFVVVDPYTITGPTGTYNAATLNTFLENGSKIRTYEGNRPFSIYWKPTVDRTLGNVSTGGRMKAPWLQFGAGTAIAHYGFHVFMQDNAFAGTFGNSYDIFYTYYMQFKSSK